MNRRLLAITLLAISVCLLARIGYGEPQGQPVEIGLVKWQRDYDSALAQAKKEQKPIFLLFQEVPG